MPYIIILIIAFIKGMNDSGDTVSGVLDESASDGGWFDGIWDGIATGIEAVGTGLGDGAVEDAVTLSTLNMSGALEGIGGEEGAVGGIIDGAGELLSNKWVLGGLLAAGVYWLINSSSNNSSST